MIGSNFYLRPVTLGDVHLLYQWRNETLVRQNSFETQIIPFIEHQNWLQCVLQDKNVLFYIMMCDDKEVGQVRLNIENNFGLINYSIHLCYRCMGYGKIIIQLLENRILELNLDIKLVANVKKSNVASQRIFENSGYSLCEKEDHFSYTKSIKNVDSIKTNVSPGGGVLFLTNNRISLALAEWLQAFEHVEIFSERLHVSMIETMRPLIVISYNYRYLISKEIINFMKGNIVNLHISYLPWNKGADPNFWSFVEETPKGVSIHLVDEGLDTGKIIIQKKLDFNEAKETFATSYEKLNEEICNLFKENWVKIRSKQYRAYEQQGNGSHHYAKDKFFILKNKTICWNENIAEFKGKCR